MTNKKELKDEELNKVAGGAGKGQVGVYCPCGCNKLYVKSITQNYESGTKLGTCKNDWVCTAVSNTQVKFYNQSLDQTIYKYFLSKY